MVPPASLTKNANEMIQRPNADCTFIHLLSTHRQLQHVTMTADWVRQVANARPNSMHIRAALALEAHSLTMTSNDHNMSETVNVVGGNPSNHDWKEHERKLYWSSFVNMFKSIISSFCPNRAINWFRALGLILSLIPKTTKKCLSPRRC